jgi:hypothetical protein
MLFLEFFNFFKIPLSYNSISLKIHLIQVSLNFCVYIYIIKNTTLIRNATKNKLRVYRKKSKCKLNEEFWAIQQCLCCKTLRMSRDTIPHKPIVSLQHDIIIIINTAANKYLVASYLFFLQWFLLLHIRRWRNTLVLLREWKEW